MSSTQQDTSESMSAAVITPKEATDAAIESTSPINTVEPKTKKSRKRKVTETSRAKQSSSAAAAAAASSLPDKAGSPVRRRSAQPTYSIYYYDGRAPETGLSLPKGRRKFTLEEMQAIVEGPIEFTMLDKSMMCIFNEEGLPRGLPPNHSASEATRMRLVGNVIVCRASML